MTVREAIARLLEGSNLSEAEAADAVEIARTTGGVRKVVKMFEYCKPTDAICAPPPPAKPAEQRPRSSP